jgi:hypothetical protein
MTTGAQQAALHLLVRDLVGVVPVRPGVLGPEAVDVLAADPHRVLRHAGHPVDGVGHVDAVPVQRDAVRDGLVDQPHLDQLPLPRPEDRPRRAAVEREAVDLLLRDQPEALLARGQRHAHVGAAGLRDQRLDGGAAPAVGMRRGAAPVVEVAHVHDVVGLGDEAGLPQPAQRSKDGGRREQGDDQPPAV